MTDKNMIKLREVTAEEKAKAVIEMTDEIYGILKKYDQISLLEKLGYLETIKFFLIKEA